MDTTSSTLESHRLCHFCGTFLLIACLSTLEDVFPVNPAHEAPQQTSTPYSRSQLCPQNQGLEFRPGREGARCRPQFFLSGSSGIVASLYIHYFYIFESLLHSL